MVILHRMAPMKWSTDKSTSHSINWTLQARHAALITLYETSSTNIAIDLFNIWWNKPATTPAKSVALRNTVVKAKSFLTAPNQ